MPKFRYLLQICFRSFVPLLGVSLLGYMVFRTGPGAVWKQVQAVGWGLALIIILGGVSQLIKTCAWRQTFACDISALSWSRSLGAQLASDAVGQLGFAGKLFGEGLRISMLGSAVPLANGISSSAIDGGLHAFTAVVVTVLGITATLLLAPLDGRWRIYALLLAAVLIAIVAISAVAVASGWQLMGNAARTIGRLPRLHKLVIGKLSVIDSAEHNLLTFYREEPVAFCASLIAQFSCGTRWQSWRCISSCDLWEQCWCGRRVCNGRIDQSDQPRWRAESGQPRDLRRWEYAHCKSVWCDGHRRIDVGFVPAGAVHLLGSSRGHLHDSDEERQVDKHNGGEGQ